MKGRKYNLDWNDYYSHDDFNEFIDKLASTYDFVNTISIGKSVEGRDMRVITINKASPEAKNVWIEAGLFVVLSCIYECNGFLN